MNSCCSHQLQYTPLTVFQYMSLTPKCSRNLAPYCVHPLLRHPPQHPHHCRCPPPLWGNLKPHNPLLSMLTYHHTGSSLQPPLLSHLFPHHPPYTISLYLVFSILPLPFHPSQCSRHQNPPWLNPTLCVPPGPLLP